MTDVDSEVRIPRMEQEEEDAASGGYESASRGHARVANISKLYLNNDRLLRLCPHPRASE